MGNMKLAVQAALSNYATFTGRAARPAYWWWVLAVFLLMVVLNLLDAYVVGPMLGLGAGDGDGGQPLALIASLGLIIPNVALGMRRLHDVGRSGWLMLLGLIPVLGVLVLLYFFLQPSVAGDNEYGPRPVWPPAQA